MMKYCCLKRIDKRAKDISKIQKKGEYLKIIQKEGQQAHYMASWLRGPPEWMSYARDPIDILRQHPDNFRLLDCASCKHKLACLVNNEAFVTFETI